LQPWTPRLTQQQQKQQQKQQQQQSPDHTVAHHSRAPHHLHSQQQQGMQRQSRPHAVTAAAAGAATPSGWNASLKMHEFLMAQQRKREQYWMSKYGKMLQPPAAVQAVGKPSRNPTSLFRCAQAGRCALIARTGLGLCCNSSSSSSSWCYMCCVPLCCQH
jgi:hypothetical protein